MKLDPFLALSQAPRQVWAILALILLLGWRQSREQSLSRGRLTMLPAAWLAFGAWSVQASFGLGAGVALAWAAGLTLSVLALRHVGWPGRVVFSPALSRYQVPGSWWPLGLMLALFSAKFALGVSLALQPELAQRLSVALGFSLLFGLVSGAFLGRALNILAHART